MKTIRLHYQRNMKGYTNVTLVMQSQLGKYAQTPAIYHCPADHSLSRGTKAGGLPRVRSISMNGYVGNPLSSGRPYTAGYLSADGALLAFEMYSGTAPSHIWVYNRLNGSTTLVSTNATGAPANGSSRWPVLSGNGRYVAFQSDATDLVPNDTNQLGDVFVRDLLTGQTTRLSTPTSSAFAGNSLSVTPCPNGDGEMIAFTSFASDLVPGDVNEASDVFVAQLVHPDSDGDGLPDDWELAYFGDLSHDGTATPMAMA